MGRSIRSGSVGTSNGTGVQLFDMREVGIPPPHCASVAFSLAGGEDHLITYLFGTGAARHLFCKVCGIKSFYIPRSNPDGFSINLRCLDEGTMEQVTVETFDGKNWEENAHELAHLSKSTT